MVLGLLLNFGMLGVVKYTNFAIENLNALFHMNLRGMEILLPLGISFYTFLVFRISSGCVLERCEAEKNTCEIMRYSYLSFHRFCRDQSEDTVVWHISFMNLINSKVRILPEALSAFSGDFLRR